MVQVRWLGKQVTDKLEAEFDRRIQTLCEELRGRIVKNISVPTATNGPSRPGEFPHADTGRLRQTIFWKKVGKLRYVLGTPLYYGMLHEFKTGRSFLRRTTIENQALIRRILVSKVRIR